MSNQEDLKHELNSELSQLIRVYEDEGLPPAEISDSLSWHSELAQSRDSVEREPVLVLSD